MEEMETDYYKHKIILKNMKQLREDTSKMLKCIDKYNQDKIDIFESEWQFMNEYHMVTWMKLQLYRNYTGEVRINFSKILNNLKQQKKKW